MSDELLRRASFYWKLSNRADPFAREIADRHYNRQKVGSPQFVPPGRCLVLKSLTPWGRAFWITSFPFAEYVLHEWAGAWVCSAFRNEGATLSSTLIIEAVQLTRIKWPVPQQGMITFVDRTKVKNKKNAGYCYLCAGFEHVGFSKSGLVCLQLSAEKIYAL